MQIHEKRERDDIPEFMAQIRVHSIAPAPAVRAWPFAFFSLNIRFGKSHFRFHSSRRIQSPDTWTFVLQC